MSPRHRATGFLARLRGDREEDAAPDARLAELQRRVHELADLELRDVMTPRVDVVYLTMPVTPEAVAEAVRDTGHSCFPVVAGDLDDVDGVLFVNDLFRSSTTKRTVGATLPDANEIARKIRRPPVMLPESMDLLEALEEMRAQRRTFAITLDEHGGVAGVVSTRDLLEPLVGDLGDEFDEDDEVLVAKIREDRWLVDGQTHVDHLRDTIGLDVPEGEYVTIAGFVMDQTGEVPESGQVVRFGEWEIRVQSVERRRVSEVVIEHRRRAEGDEAPLEGAAPTE
jgi:CBS domain containing-hemolysin-like protein